VTDRLKPVAWLAAAKAAGLYDEAIALARSSPCAPQTLTRAARDFAEKEPAVSEVSGELAGVPLLQAPV
jgi:hypothetical protein